MINQDGAAELNIDEQIVNQQHIFILNNFALTT